LWAYDCNNYIGEFTSGKTKCKGRFEFEAHDKYEVASLHKNKSHLIVPKAIFNYFVKGIQPRDFLVHNRNIFDYCGGVRAKGNWKFEAVSVIKNPDEIFYTYDEIQKKEHIKSKGWLEYEGNSWIKQEWIDKNEPYDRLATSLENAFISTLQNEYVLNRDELQKTIRYYISKTGSKIIKVNKSDGREIQVEAGKPLCTVFNTYKELPWEHYGVDDKYYLEQIYKEIKTLEPPTKNQLQLF
jgi:hypothetical protein